MIFGDVPYGRARLRARWLRSAWLLGTWLQRGEGYVCRNATSTSSCDSHAWLFILATGRSGSTTILNMLNAIPHIQLSGENGELVPMLAQTLEYTNRLSHKQARFGTAWLNSPYRIGLRDAVCDWLLHLLQPRPGRVPSLVRGFKEVRVNRILPFLLRHLPNARYILSHRLDVTAQASSGYHALGANVSQTIVQDELYIRTHVRAAGRPMFELAVENFTTARFNELLVWIGITGCKYRRIAHSNKDGKSKVSWDDDAVSIIGSCHLALPTIC